tara:strand:- start:1888 stop:2460 length:573 start_codon:yes stop_codon:yes gene_type:complete
MSKIKIILYDCLDIYKILDEINDFLNFDLVNANQEFDFNSYTKNLDKYLVVTKEKKKFFSNQIILSNLPIKISQLIEKINLEILKENFNLKSNVKIGKYILDTNSREIFYKEKKFKLTEQEIKILTYLTESNASINVEKLQKDIWGYGEDLETHTVETHIHRLRKKFVNFFGDKNFILSSKKGYYIKSVF